MKRTREIVTVPAGSMLRGQLLVVGAVAVGEGQVLVLKPGERAREDCGRAPTRRSE